MFQSARPLAARQRILDTVAVEQDRIVAGAALREQRFGLGSALLAFARVVEHPGLDPEHQRPAEAHPGLAGQRERVLDALTRVVQASRRERACRQSSQDDRLEASRANRLRQRQSARQQRLAIGMAIAERQQQPL